MNAANNIATTHVSFVMDRLGAKGQVFERERQLAAVFLLDPQMCWGQEQFVPEEAQGLAMVYQSTMTELHLRFAPSLSISVVEYLVLVAQ